MASNNNSRRGSSQYRLEALEHIFDMQGMVWAERLQRQVEELEARERLLLDILNQRNSLIDRLQETAQADNEQLMRVIDHMITLQDEREALYAFIRLIFSERPDIQRDYEADLAESLLRVEQRGNRE